MKTFDLAEYLDSLLNVCEIRDDSLNGLQVANSGTVSRIAVSVDISQESIEKTHEAGCDFLLVHHGLFWGAPLAVVDQHYARIKGMIDYDIALYAAHLPLDMHPELGNNAQVMNVLGWPVKADFGDYHGLTIGKKIEFREPVSIRQLAATMDEKLGTKSIVWNFGKKEIQTIGYVSGGALSMMDQAIRDHLDCYITGEPRHSSYWEAKEAGLNVILAGHYATETLGVKAVARHLSDKFKIEHTFINLPTGF